MKILLSVLIVLLSGCTIYKIKSERDETGLVTTNVSIYTSRNLVDPTVAYTRKGTDASFNFGAASTTQPGPQDYAAGIAAGIAAAGGINLTPAPPPPTAVTTDNQ